MEYINEELKDLTKILELELDQKELNREILQEIHADLVSLEYKMYLEMNRGE